MLGPELLEESATQVRMIRKHMLAAQCRQKAYADGKRRDLEFQPGEKVFVKVSPTKEVLDLVSAGSLTRDMWDPLRS